MVETASSSATVISGMMLVMRRATMVQPIPGGLVVRSELQELLQGIVPLAV